MRGVLQHGHPRRRGAQTGGGRGQTASGDTGSTRSGAVHSEVPVQGREGLEPVHPGVQGHPGARRGGRRLHPQGHAQDHEQGHHRARLRSHRDLPPGRRRGPGGVFAHDGASSITSCFDEASAPLASPQPCAAPAVLLTPPHAACLGGERFRCPSTWATAARWCTRTARLA